MGFDDKAENKAEDLKGRAKEAAGSVTGDDELKNEGRADQAESSVKQAGEKVKDAVERRQGRVQEVVHRRHTRARCGYWRAALPHW